MTDRFKSLLRRFRRDERGAFLVLFGVLALVLIATSGAVVDFTAIEQARTRAQNALDAATLGLHPTMYDEGVTAETLRVEAESLMAERVGVDGIVATVDSADADLAAGALRFAASIQVPTAFVSLVGFPEVTARVSSEVLRGSSDVEVAVALDVTGSMLGQRIIDLRDATKDLIDIVVQDQQQPTYSKMALVPYSMGVKVGGHADAVRGPLAESKAITGAAWAQSERTINRVSKGNPAVVTTSTNHGFATGDTVYITGARGGHFDRLNERKYSITVTSNTRFRLNGLSTSNWNGSYSRNSARVRKCITRDCEVVISSASHGFSNDQLVYIDDVRGMTELNNRLFRVRGVAQNSFVLADTDGTDWGTYSSGGEVFCTTAGCQYYFFQSAGWNPWYPSGQWNLFRASTCVTERTGASAYTDAAPQLAPVGRNYATPTVLSQYYTSSPNPCLSNEITPLSSNKAMLKAEANALVAAGSTSGHIGIGWAWYMVSPEFGYLWPEASRPAAYDAPNLIKVVILMTDGEFNTVYCNGVIAQNSTEGSGAPVYQHNCNSPNGSSYTQAERLCSAIKAAGVTVYTVGFDIGNARNAVEVMSNCATSPNHAYLAASGTDLKQAFREIGRDIASLRLSK